MSGYAADLFAKHYENLILFYIKIIVFLQRLYCFKFQPGLIAAYKFYFQSTQDKVVLYEL